MSNIVVSGASSGLGESIALHFAANGDTVCAISRSKEKLEKVVTKYSDNIYFYSLDISKSEMVINVFSSIFKDHGLIDVLINNAGIHMNSEFADVEYDLKDKIIAVQYNF